MAIQVRRGNEADFDPSKMLPGEWAISTDARYVRMCFVPGIVLRMATYESFEADMAKVREILSTCQSIEEVVTRIASEVNANTEIVVENTELSKQYMEQAKIYAENASAVSGVEIATQDRAGLVKGGENYIAEDGTLELTRKTTDTTLSNSYAGGLKINSILGNTQQDSTTGKQLFDINTVTEGILNASNGTIVSISSWRTSDFMKVESETEYCVSQTTTAYFQYNIGFYDADKTFISAESFGQGDTLYKTVTTPANAEYMRISYSVTVGGIAVDRGNIVVNMGNKPVDWEPYTGGIPSPNPLYPQSINSAVVSEVKVSGKNQLDISKGTSANSNLVYCENDSVVIKASTYVNFSNSITISHDGYVTFSTHAKPTANNIGLKITKNGTTILEQQYTTEQDIVKSFEVVSGDVLEILFRSSSAGSGIFTECMLEKGTTATAYEPYQENSITLSEPIELKEWDTISEGKLSNGSSDVFINSLDRIVNVTELSTVVRFVYSVEQLGTSDNNLFCDKLQCKIDYAGDYEHCYRAGSGTQILFYINKERFATLDNAGYLEYLSTNPFSMLYELSEPVVTELPSEDVIALNSLKTYAGVSYVSIISNIQPDFEFEYGTSRVGGYALEALNTANRNELHISALNALTNSISTAMVEREE